MAKKTTDHLPPPNLVIPREIARSKIQAQIEKGQTLRNAPINSRDDLEKARAERSKWSKYNTELLNRIFDNSSMADEYNRFYGAVISMKPTFSQLVDEFRKDMDDSITRLEAIRDRLDLIPVIPELDVQLEKQLPSGRSGRDVFIVHGHDDAAKEAVARFVEKIGLKAIVLHEQPNAGRTIIEKFESYSSVSFAVVLLTPDDVGAPRDRSSEGQPRARQNVIFELGYFIGKLGRQRVCALYKEDVELPSDIHGVLYVPMDSVGAWRMMLAREMKQVGLPIDMNQVV